MATRALVIGGSGVTGIHVVNGLAERGYEVTVLHRGVHEDPALESFPHIHADPHFDTEIERGIDGESFDVVVAMYGRLETIARVFAGRCERFVGVGGTPIYAGLLAPDSVTPRGTILDAVESSPLADPATIANERTARFVSKLRAAEAAVLDGHAAGHFWATHIRYPLIYGPHALRPLEWSIVKRIQDGRRQLLLPSGGLPVTSRCAAQNAAHCLLLALETPAAGGEVFNCADADQFSMAQWAEVVAAALDADLQQVDVPEPLHWLVSHLLLAGGTASKHAFFDTTKAQTMLGYRDLVPARDAIAETATTLAEQGPSPQQAKALGDAFDYALEDRVIARLAGLSAEFAADAVVPQAVHSYAHPVAPGAGGDHRGR
jgi:nucleoside-diphosphate-sugar epimerase